MKVHEIEGEDSSPIVKIRKPTVHEEQLFQWFSEQRFQSVANLEQAGRQIMTLCTTLLTVLLGLMALTEETLPGYMDHPIMRGLGIISVILFFAALVGALDVVRPRPWSVDLNRPDELQVAYEKLLDAKSVRLKIALGFFGGAMLCLTVMIVLSLIIL